MSLQKHFEQFIQTGLYLRGWSIKTPNIYRRAFARFSTEPSNVCDFRTAGEPKPSRLESSARSLGHFHAPEGMSPAGCNIYIRAMNFRPVTISGILSCRSQESTFSRPCAWRWMSSWWANSDRPEPPRTAPARNPRPPEANCVEGGRGWRGRGRGLLVQGVLALRRG